MGSCKGTQRIGIQWSMTKSNQFLGKQYMNGENRGKWPTQCASRAEGISYGFWIIYHVNRSSSPLRYVPGKFDPTGLFTGAHILRTYKCSTNELKNTFFVNPVESFYKIDKNLNFDLFCPYLGSKRVQAYGPWGAIFYTLLKVVTVSL